MGCFKAVLWFLVGGFVHQASYWIVGRLLEMAVYFFTDVPAVTVIYAKIALCFVMMLVTYKLGGKNTAFKIGVVVNALTLAGSIALGLYMI